MEDLEKWVKKNTRWERNGDDLEDETEILEVDNLLQKLSTLTKDKV